uniref:Uncharacterized protein n=1 Tax=Rhizophora mucronata TaxID=61149 RepID=A0A2P2NDB3_RHIMU
MLSMTDSAFSFVLSDVVVMAFSLALGFLCDWNFWSS